MKRRIMKGRRKEGIKRNFGENCTFEGEGEGGLRDEVCGKYSKNRRRLYFKNRDTSPIFFQKIREASPFLRDTSPFLKLREASPFLREASPFLNSVPVFTKNPVYLYPRLHRTLLFILIMFSWQISWADTGAGGNPAGSIGQLRTSLAMGTSRQTDIARGDLISLEQAFRAALEGSRDLEASRDRLLEAHNDIELAWSNLRPGLSIVSSITRNDKEITYPNPDGSTRIAQRLYQQQVGMNLRQVVFQCQAMPTIRALRQLQSAERLSSIRLRSEVLYAVAATYYSVLALQDTKELAERQLEDTKKHLDVVKARYELDAANRLDLLRAEVDHRSAVEDLRITEGSLASTKIALATLIGRPHDEGDFSVIRPEAPSTDILTEDEGIMLALESRADFAAFEKQVAAAEHLVSAARMAFIPSLELTANARYSPVISFLRDDQITWLATLNLTIPIYQGGSRLRRVDSARLRERQLIRSRDNFADRIRQEVMQARIELDTASSQLQRIEGMAELAAEALELARARYELGAATSLDVTDALTRAFISETQVLRGRLELDMALLSLARAMGLMEEVVFSTDI